MEGLGIAPLNAVSRAVQRPILGGGRAVLGPPSSTLHQGGEGVPQLHLALSAWPQEDLKVQNKINSLNPSNFLQTSSAGGRPMFCGLQWASVSVPRCLRFDDYIPKTRLWCFSVPTNNICKTSHRGPKSSPMASVELLLILELLVWVPAPKCSR